MVAAVPGGSASVWATRATSLWVVPAGREPAADLRFDDGFDQDVAGQPDVDRADPGGRGEQRRRRLGRLAPGVVDARLHPQGEAGMARIVPVGGGRIHLGLGPVEGAGAAARLGRAEHAGGPGSAWLALSVAARWNRAAADDQPPRPRARAPARSSSPATASSGPVAAWARCQARWSGSAGPVAAARPACVRWRWAKVRAVVDRGADQRVPEPDRVADGDQLPGLGRGRRLAGEARGPGRPGRAGRGHRSGRRPRPAAGTGCRPAAPGSPAGIAARAGGPAAPARAAARSLGSSPEASSWPISMRASGLPPVSATIRSAAGRRSRGPAAAASRARASASASPARRSSGSPSSRPGRARAPGRRR